MRYYLYPILLFFLCLAANPMFAQQGYSEVQYDVTNEGGATTSIPIVASPGTNNLQPALALSYNSQAPNGLLGLGWSLEGLFSITRVSSTLAQDGRNDGVTFSPSDKFALNGERLINVNGEYGVSGTEYRTEQESFSRIISYGNAGGGPARFVVWTKEGLIMDFGATGDSRLQGQGKTAVFCWKLNKVRDRHGNYYEIKYQKYTDKTESVPTRINYTGNAGQNLVPYASIRFEYNNRSDIQRGYLAGSRIQLSKKLKYIRCYHGASLLRSYEMNYAQTGISKFPRITSIKEYGINNNQNFTPIQFSWGPENNSGNFNVTGQFPNNGYGVGANNYNYLTGDFNGDGKTDLVHLAANDGVHVWHSSGDGTYTILPKFRPSPTYAVGMNNYNYEAGDFNGDGMTDLIHFIDNAGVTVWLSNGNGTFTTGPKFRPDPTYAVGANNYNYRVADFNGDGQTDLVHLVDDRVLRVWFSKGDGTFTVTIPFSPPGAPGYNMDANEIISYDFRLGDFNGDGMADMIHMADDDYVHVWQSLGTGGFLVYPQFNPAGNYGVNANDYRYEIGDFNGDGLTDLLHLVNDDYVQVWMSKGNGNFDIRPSFFSSDIDKNDYEFRTGDFNGDGKTDLLHLFDDDEIKVWLSKGDGQFAIRATVVPSGYDVENNNYRFLTGDHNGDGKTDLTHFYTSSGVRTWINPNSHNQNRITRVTNGHDRTDFLYQPLSNDGIYTKLGNVTYPIIDYQGPFKVVSKMRRSDGLGGLNDIDYRYEGARFHVYGRGFRGFRKTRTYDQARNQVTVNWFNTDYRCLASRVERQEIRLTNNNNKLARLVQNTIRIIPKFNNRTYFSYYEKSIVSDFKLNNNVNNAVYKRVITDLAYDDFGNITQEVVGYYNGNESGDLQHQRTINYNIHNATSSWILGRITAVNTTNFRPNQPSRPHRQTFQYSNNWVNNIGMIVEPNRPTFKQTFTFQYNGFGNRTLERIVANNGTNLQTRNTNYFYSPDNRFVIRERNALGQDKSYTYDPLLGRPLTSSDLNGLQTVFTYDAFGRVKSISRPGQSPEFIGYSFAGGNAKRSEYTETSGAGKPTVRTWKDIFGQTTRTCRQDRLGRFICTDANYNKAREIFEISEPYFNGNQALKFTRYTYDPLFRLRQTTLPGNRVRNTYYDGLISTVVNESGQAFTQTEDAVGNVLQTRDDNLKLTNFTFNSDNLLIQTDLPQGVEIRTGFDLMGRQVFIDDPNMGYISKTHNAFGELISTTDARGKTTTLSYDKLGRRIRQQSPAGVDTWTYDQGVNGRGNLTESKSFDNYRTRYVYDSEGRLKDEISIDPNQTTQYVFNTTYDANGLIDLITYPSGFRIKHEYSNQGRLIEIKNQNSGKVYWTFNNANARHQITEETLGNNLVTNYTYNNNNGWLTKIRTQGGGNSLQDLEYQYDPLGNMSQRRNLINGRSENFTYDNLNRLATSKVDNRQIVTHNYNDLGNLMFRSDVGCYTYGSDKPNAATAIKDGGGNVIRSMQYDASGNMTSNGQLNIQYRFNQIPWRVNSGQQSQRFRLNVNGNRTLSEVFDGTDLVSSKRYAGGLYEKHITVASNQTKHLHYIFNGERTVAIVETGDVNQTRYLHHDNLGSLESISRPNGTLIQNLSHNPWGQRRNPNTWVTTGNPAAIYDRGFTFQEHLEFGELIHMNGRICDPTIGRFTSADPYVEASELLQTFNRYSYVGNNPLTNTDPTGLQFGANGTFSTGFVRLSISNVFRAYQISAPASSSFFGQSYSFNFGVSGNFRGFSNTNTTSKGAKALNRTFAAIGLVGDGLQGVFSVGLIVAPEPGTTALGVGLGFLTIDSGQANLRQLITGEQRNTALNGAFQFLGASPDEANLLELGVNLVVPGPGDIAKVNPRGTRIINNSSEVGKAFNTVGDGIDEGGLVLYKRGAPQTSEGPWRTGDRMIIFEGTGNKTTDWQINEGILLQEIKKGRPIFDSFTDANGNLLPTTGFLKGERDLLEANRWTFDPNRGAWLPPGSN